MNDYLKYSLCILLLLLCGVLVQAETIVGVVRNADTQDVMPFVTISVLAEDSTLLTGAITDEHGAYCVEVVPGAYVLQASFVGYKTEYQSVAPMVNFFMKEEMERLAEVEVKAKKPFVERQMDKLVLHVSESPLASGSTAKDLLKLAPGVNVDKDGKVTVNGKAVTVYIDNRPSYLSGEQLKAMLEGTDGNTIEKIEVISNPSAKYDAAGSGGIINIKTKRNMMKGLNGTLSASYGGMYFEDIERYNQKERVSLVLNYRTEKTYTFVSLTQMYAGVAQQMLTQTSMPIAGDTMRTFNESLYDARCQSYNLKVGNDWMIDKKNTLGFIFRTPVLVGKYDSEEGKSGSVITLGQDTLERSLTRTWGYVSSPQHCVNLNYTHTFNDSLGQELTANIDYNRYLSGNGNGQENEVLRGETRCLNGLRIETDQIVNIYSAKVDFETQFWQTGIIEAGVKYALSQTKNDMTTDSLTEGVLCSTTPTAFHYAEHVAAAYVTVGKQFGSNWNAKLGLRGEYTHSVGDWLTADSVTGESYFNVFPTLFVGYTSNPLGKLEQMIHVSASYTRRIDRPSYYMLNPFVSYYDAHSYSVGNTELAPAFDNEVELSFGYSQYVSISANFSHTQNMMAEKVLVMPNGDRRDTWENFGSYTSHGVNVSLTEIPIVPKTSSDSSQEGESRKKKLTGAWLTLTAYAGYYNYINRSFEARVSRNHNFYVNGTLNAYLPKDWIVSLGCWYNGPQIEGYRYTYGMGAMFGGVRKRFPKQGLTLNLQCFDMLRSGRYREESIGMAEGYYASFYQPGHWQDVSLSLSYTFGTQQWHKQRNVGHSDEESRLGGGGKGK